MTPPISREPLTYMVKGVLAETPDHPWPERSTAEIQAYHDRLKAGHEAHILRLPMPILCEKDGVADIFSFNRSRKAALVYPPFELNDLAENAGAFKDVLIPEGEKQITSHTQIPNVVPPAVTHQPTAPPKDLTLCQGLRIDVETGCDAHVLLESILAQICQYTHQWWLRATASPFNGMLRFGAQLGKDSRILPDFRYAGAGQLESTWYTARQTRPLLGLEVPLNNGKWLLACDNVSLGKRPCAGVIAFHDALAAYMSDDDVRCVLHLCISVEILGNKRRLLLSKRPVAADKLIKCTDLATEPERKILTDLLVDRGHVAHGRELHRLGHQAGVTLERYIETTRSLLRRYIANLAPGQWPDAAQLKVKRPKR